MTIASEFHKLIDLKEYTEEQPDLFNKELSTFYVDDDIVKVQPNKSGSKDYVFSPEFSDEMFKEIEATPENDDTILRILARAYIDDDEVANIFKNANREDFIVMNTSNDVPLKLSMNDLFMYITAMSRDDRFADEENSVQD